MNHGERAKYYVEDTHPAIVSKDIFDRAQEDMKRRERIVRNDDGSIEASKSKSNSKYILGNIPATKEASLHQGISIIFTRKIICNKA